MCFIPMQLSLANCTISKLYDRNSFHLSPTPFPIRALQMASNLHTSPRGNDFYICYITNDLKWWDCRASPSL